MKPEIILETLGLRWNHMLNGKSCTHAFTRTFTARGNLDSPDHVVEKPERTQTQEKPRELYTDSNMSLGSNKDSWSNKTCLNVLFYLH